MEGVLDSSHDQTTLELATAAASRRLAGSAVLIGAVTVLGTSIIAYLGYAGSRSITPWGVGVAVAAGALISLSLALLYRSYRRTQKAALAIASSLRQSEARYRNVYHHTPIMMHSIDREGRLVRLNDHWLKTLGYRRHEVIGQPLTDFLTADSKRFVTEVAMPQFFERGHIHELPYELVTRDGRTIDVLVSATAERDDAGQILRSQTMLVDVSRVKRVEAEREEVIRQLEQKNAELQRFTYTVSHDLKGPLVTIKGFLGYIKKDAAEGNLERVQGDVERVSEAADKMRELLDGLLELSRIGRMVNPPESVNLGDLALQARELLAGAVTERGVEIAIAADLPTIRCDRVRMLQVFQNLLENAVKFMDGQPAPRVEVGGGQEGEKVTCFVRDNGIGIEPEHHEKIFELFQKMDRDKEGTGIGLALVQAIIEFHGGRIWVESEGAGAGSTFYFTVPVAPQESDQVSSPS